ncbi:hypothetical protein ACFSFY_07625 [Sporosarcina siberiensis]|uniref:Uncharacterized protein n=1 Tax=Sporosarcina siberiensis TaxID=1365606 RepID=A0ABW4SEL8_9BACL
MEATEILGEKQVMDSRSHVSPQMSVGAWILTFVILMIPLVNIIMMFIWAFDATSLRRNFARAYLIVAGIMIALWIVGIIILVALGSFSGIFTNFTQFN